MLVCVPLMHFKVLKQNELESKGHWRQVFIFFVERLRLILNFSHGTIVKFSPCLYSYDMTRMFNFVIFIQLLNLTNSLRFFID